MSLFRLHSLRQIMCRSTYNLLHYRESHEMTSKSDDIPIVSLVDIKRQLRLCGYSLDDGFTCLISKCPNCKRKGKEPGKVYINKTTGFYVCSCCEKNGQWNYLEKIIKGKIKGTNVADEGTCYHKEFSVRWQEVLASSRSAAEMTQEEIEVILRKYNFPIFPDANKILKDVRVTEDKLIFPLKDLSGGVCGFKSLLYRQNDSDVNLEEQCEGGGGVIQIGSGPGSGSKSATLVPTLGDVVALAASKHTGPIICPPLGFNNLPQEVLPILEGYTRLILWGSSDIRDNISAIARKLSDERCLLVRCLEYQGGALDAMKQGADLRNLMATAKPVWHKAITTFSSLREDVLSDLHNIDKVRGIKWKRYPALNRLIQGHRRGELSILTGPTGSGKTTFCSEYSLDLAMQGVNTLWGSFEIRNSRLARTMLQQFSGIPLEHHLKEFDRFANEFEKLPIHFLMFHGQQTIKDVMEAVEHAFYIHDIAHVVIDNVQFMLGIGDESSHRVDRFWRQDAVITAFRSFATRRNCHVTLVMHPRKERDVDELSTNSIFGSAKASQEADNVFIIQDRRLTAVRGKKYLQVAKNRYSGDLGIVPLEFDKEGLSYAQKKKEHSTKPKDQVPHLHNENMISSS